MSMQDIEGHLSRLEDERCAAMVRGDRERLRQLLHPGLQHVHAKGQVDSYESYLAEGGFKVDYTRVERSDMKVQMLADGAALMTGRQLLEAVRKASGEHIRIDSRVTQVWVKVSTDWQQLSFQTTPIEMTTRPANALPSADARRIVTGVDASGKSTVVIDESLQAQPAAHDRFVWTTSVTPADASGSADAAKAPHTLEPPAKGSIFRLLEVRPERLASSLTPEQKEAAVRRAFAAMRASHCLVDTRRAAGMHQTSSLDYVVVLRGEVTLVLDEGEVTLRAGDVVVQQATNHAWVVRGEAPALLGVVMLDARVGSQLKE